MSTYLREIWKFIQKNETARGLLLVGIVILGALGVWGGIRLALNTEYPVLVVSSGSMCPPTNCVLPIGSLIVIRGQDPRTIVAGPPPVGTIIVFRPYLSTPDFLVVHRVVEIRGNQSRGEYFFITEGDANRGSLDPWDSPGPGSPYGGVPASQVVGVYQSTIPIPYLGSAILDIRSFMYDDATQQPRPEGILVIVILIIALFAFEVIEPSKKPKPNASLSEAKAEPARAQAS
ncbi:MAG: signal peptidase I [Crenarchaeota archaeon 13_1_40CM_3_52_10]|nr:MAG: signal peptidase I [Crenarchaeota archaeon 13_1_40CM_3_52_10]